MLIRKALDIVHGFGVDDEKAEHRIQADFPRVGGNIGPGRDDAVGFREPLHIVHRCLVLDREAGDQVDVHEGAPPRLPDPCCNFRKCDDVPVQDENDADVRFRQGSRQIFIGLDCRNDRRVPEFFNELPVCHSLPSRNFSSVFRFQS